MYSTNEFRKGLKIEIDGEPYLMVDNEFVKPGKGQAFNRVRLKNLIDGRVVDRTYKSGEKVKKADVSEQSMQFLYEQGDEFHFMNTETYEQVSIPRDKIGEAWRYLSDGLICTVLSHNDQPITVEVPNFVVLEITHCEPGVRGDTAQGATKPATLSTGHVVQVPLFIEQGDRLKIDTRTGEYVERAKE